MAVRPLRVEELAEVLAFEFATAQGEIPRYRAGWRSNDQDQAVLSTCSSLIAIVDDHGSQIVQFMHFSVKEFLMSDRLTSSHGDFSRYQIHPGPAHTVLAQACLGFLLHLDGPIDKESVEAFPLAEYAARHWATHAEFKDVALRVKHGMEALFDCDKPHFTAWVGIFDADNDYSWDLPSTIPTPLYYSSIYGFSDLVEHLSTKHPEHLNAIGGRYKFPLFAALKRRHFRVAEILLNHGADINCQIDDRTPLSLATVSGDLEVANVLLKHKADVDSQNKDGRTPLHLLVEDHYTRDVHLSLIRLLLEHGADPNRRNKDNKTLLSLAMRDYAIPDPARLLLKYGADGDARMENEWTLLHLAAFNGRIRDVRLLLDHGTNVNAKNDQGETPLCLVSSKYYPKEHDVDIARLFLEAGADVNALDKVYNTPLHHASFMGRVEIASVLLENGANLNVENDNSEMPLHLAPRGGYHSHEDGVSVARMLLKRGVDVNAPSKDHNTPLHSASYFGSLTIAGVLLDCGANVNAENEQGETPLHLVSRGGTGTREDCVGVAQMLLERGADVNASDKGQNTPLHSASYAGRVEIVKALLTHGANTNAENDQGETPLHVVLRGGTGSHEDGVRIARMLLERSADVNAPDKSHNTPLHSASRFGSLTIARVLLDSGANMNAENNQGETPLHIVLRGGTGSHEDGVGVAQMLLERGADVNAPDKSHNTPLHSASYFGRLEITGTLLDHRANEIAENKQGETPLHLVSRGKYDSQDDGVGIARLLLARGVDINARKCNFTPLLSAAFKGRLKIVQALLDRGADVGAVSGKGETPLHFVSRGKYDSVKDGVGVVRMLLERGVDVNAQDRDKDTPLHSASYFGSLEIARILLDHGANVNVENKQGKTPLHLVSRGKCDSHEHSVSITELLLERGAHTNAQGKDFCKDNTTTLNLARYLGALSFFLSLGTYIFWSM